MSYAVSDFHYSLEHDSVRLTRDDVAEVLFAWGNVDADGQCCEECGGEWSGGFIMRMKDGRIARLTGSCDYTGWGCQDGAKLEMLDAVPEPPKGADLAPADLNGYLLTGSHF